MHKWRCNNLNEITHRGKTLNSEIIHFLLWIFSIETVWNRFEEKFMQNGKTVADIEIFTKIDKNEVIVGILW